MEKLQLDAIACRAIDVVKQAGNRLIAIKKHGLTIDVKSDGSLVTNADVEIQEFLIQQLSLVLPSAHFIAEENDVNQSLNGLCWVIDPIDGTTNYVRAIPYFCISVALVQKNQPLLGIVYHPLLDECYHAILHNGAFLNAQPITVSTINERKNALLMAEVGNAAFQTYLFKNFESFSNNYFSCRILGSAALSLAYVAAGRADVAWYEQLSWWDIAAGILLVREAGGIVSTYDGQDITPAVSSVVAANKQLHPIILTTLQNP